MALASSLQRGCPGTIVNGRVKGKAYVCFQGAWPGVCGDRSECMTSVQLFACAAFAPGSKVARRAVIVRAEASTSTSGSEASFNRRTVLGASLAAAGAAALPLGLTAPAEANQVLSSDWELVRHVGRDSMPQGGGWHGAWLGLATWPFHIKGHG